MLGHFLAIYSEHLLPWRALFDVPQSRSRSARVRPLGVPPGRAPACFWRGVGGRVVRPHPGPDDPVFGLLVFGVSLAQDAFVLAGPDARKTTGGQLSEGEGPWLGWLRLVFKGKRQRHLATSPALTKGTSAVLESEVHAGPDHPEVVLRAINYVPVEVVNDTNVRCNAHFKTHANLTYEL